MSARIARALPAWAAVGLPLLVALLAWDASVPRSGARTTVRWLPGLEHWDIPELAEHLRTAGLSFRVLGTAEGAYPADRAYLTTTPSTRRELDHLVKVPERLHDWKGVVYCERNLDDPNRALRLHLWGECCLCAEPFLFFGDPELLEEIRHAIQVSATL
jgi:hypothetical protein